MPAYKDQKNNTWFAKFSYKNWKNETKFTTKRGFKTKREALQYERDFKERIAGKLDMKFGEFVKIYREEYYPRIRVSTATMKDYIIEDKILPYFTDHKIASIKSTDIIRWQNELLAFRKPTNGQPYSKTYLKTIHNQMSAIMNFAVKYYDLKVNPVAKAGSIGSGIAEEMDFWTLNEYLLFSEAMMDDMLYYYCFEVLYWTGIRSGELLALQRQDFDFGSKTISINKTFQVVKGKELIGPPKTFRSIRTVNMPDHLSEQMKDYFSFCYDHSYDRVFPVTKSSLSRKMTKGSQKAGVKRIRVHDLRHSHISLLISLGFNPVEIAKRVGHESIAITLRYAHMFPAAQEEMMSELNTIIKENNNECEA